MGTKVKKNKVNFNGKMVSIGIDMHKHSWHITVVAVALKRPERSFGATTDSSAYSFTEVSARVYISVVCVGNTVFLNSFDGRSLETGEVTSDRFEEQLIVCLDNIRLPLGEEGSSMSNLVKYFILLKNYRDEPRMWKAMLEYYKKKAAISPNCG